MENSKEKYILADDRSFSQVSSIKFADFKDAVIITNALSNDNYKKSKIQWDCAGASEYLESNKTPADYKDVVSGGKVGKDMKALITISPKWEEDADIETKLEKIITQKWLACWPESYEAWAEQRRTGYPKLFKVQSNTGKVIDTDIMIRRLPFSTDAATADPAQYATLTEKLGGADNGATRLWWDTGKNSF